MAGPAPPPSYTTGPTPLLLTCGGRECGTGHGARSFCARPVRGGQWATESKPSQPSGPGRPVDVRAAASAQAPEGKLKEKDARPRSGGEDASRAARTRVRRSQTVSAVTREDVAGIAVRRDGAGGRRVAWRWRGRACPLFQVELGLQAADGGEDASEAAPGGGSNVSTDAGRRPAARAQLRGCDRRPAELALAPSPSSHADGQA